jgi:hypothetical protein
MVVKELQFNKTTHCDGEDALFSANTKIGRITVLDRLTGWGNGDIRDIETGYKDLDGKFWLVSGQFDIRKYPDLTIEEAIGKIKENANTCIGI